MDKARKLTDKELAKLEREISELYFVSQAEISEKWNKYMQSHKKKLDKLYDKLQEAKKSGDKDAIRDAEEEYERAVKNVTLNDKRYKAMINETTAKMANVNQIALDYVNGDMPKIYTLNYNEFDNQDIDGYSFTLVNERAVENLIKSNKIELPPKKVNIPKDQAWNAKNINSQLLQGIIQGENITKIAKRLQNVTDMNKKSAIRNARTMVTGAENKGRQDSFKKAQDDGVIMTRTWVATHDERTRAWHSDLDGVEVGLDEPWENDYGEIMFPGDPTADPANVYNCRCSIRAHVKGFKWSKERLDEVKDELSDLKQSYKNNVKDLSKLDVINKFIAKDSYINSDTYRDILTERTKSLSKQDSIISEINELEDKLKKLEAVPKPKSEWNAEDMMKSIMGKTPMVQSEESKELEKQIDDLWKKHGGLSGIITKTNDIIEKSDKENYLMQIKDWHSDKPKISTDSHFKGFSTKMRIGQYDEDLANGIGYIAEMSPTEYLERCAYDIFDSTYESAVLGADAGSILKYAKQMSEGVEFDMGYLDYNSKKQEGRHRAMAAKLLGIDKIPVYIRGR
jgi:SPP1 gp7 family putative phage head morphogenesis protein